MDRQAAISSVSPFKSPPTKRVRMGENSTPHSSVLQAYAPELIPPTQQSNTDVEIIDLESDQELNTSTSQPSQLQNSQNIGIVPSDNVEIIDLDNEPDCGGLPSPSCTNQTSNQGDAYVTATNVSPTTPSDSFHPTLSASASVPPTSSNPTHPNPPYSAQARPPIANSSAVSAYSPTPEIPTSYTEQVRNVLQHPIVQSSMHLPAPDNQTQRNQPVSVSQAPSTLDLSQPPMCSPANTSNITSHLIHITDSGSMYRELADGIEIIDSDDEQDLGQNRTVSSSGQGLPLATTTTSIAHDQLSSHPPNLFGPSMAVGPHFVAASFSNHPYSVEFPVASEQWAQQPHQRVHTQNVSSSNVSRPMLTPVPQHIVSRAVQQILPNVPPPTISMSPTDSGAVREGVDNGLTDHELHTLVKQHRLTADAEKEAGTPSEMTIELLPHQKRALEWMSKRECPMDLGEDVVAADDECLGGVLADEQGLGKTLSMISVMLKNKPRIGIRNGVRTLDDRPLSDDDDYFEEVSQRRLPWRSLVVCPLSLMWQWRTEIVNSIREDVRPTICIYHGPKRNRVLKRLKSSDIVITTYSTLTSEYPRVLKNLPENQWRKEANLKLIRRKPGPIFSVHWRRAVLDEAHMVKNRNTESWRAVMSLKADRRWCLTGTPIANSVDDIYSLFCFVRYNFVPNYEMWNHRWKKLLESPSEQTRQKAFQRFQTICGVAVLRRTKKDTINGRPLLSLPKREINLVDCEFTDGDEQAAYNYASSNTMETLNEQLKNGTTAMSYSNVLVMLLRLRQACCHPFLEEYGRLCRGKGGKEYQRYVTPYSTEELEEAMELSENQQSLLDMLEDSVRVRVERSLQPPEESGGTIWGPFQCSACGAQRRWEEGMYFSCGHQFCGECCEKARRLQKCLRCNYSVGADNGMEVELNANDLRMEVHANTILGNGNLEVMNISNRKLREWAKEEVKRYRSHGAMPLLTHSTIAESDCASDDEIEIVESTEGLYEMGNSNGNDGSSNLLQKRKQQFLKAFSIESTKIKRILHELDQVQNAGNGEKTLIFSQWTTMLDIIEFHVEKRGHATCRLDGQMTIGCREAQIEEFKRSKEKNVLLISLRSGGTGLNLTAASRVIMVDVWWNPCVEEQAIDRVHRIGQTRTVHVTKFRLKNTVEERIYAICAAKRAKVSGALGDTSAQSLGRQKLSFAELLGIFRGEARQVAHLATPGSAAAEAAENILQMSDPFPHSL